MYAHMCVIIHMSSIAPHFVYRCIVSLNSKLTHLDRDSPYQQAILPA